MGRSLLCLAVVLAVVLAATAPLAAQPVGNYLVIRPRPPAAEPAPAAAALQPDKPGYITIRPRGLGGRTQLVAAGQPTPAPVAGPTAQQPPDAKPAEKAVEAEGKIVYESWYAMFLKGLKAGHYHVVVREYERDGKTFRYATKTQKLLVARFGQPAEIWGEDSTLETPEGQVLVTRMRQGLGKNQMLSLAGTVEGTKLKVKIEGMSKGEDSIPFPAGVLGIAKEATLFADRKPKPGDTFDYRWWEGRVNRVVEFTVNAKKLEDLVIYDNQPAVAALRLELAMAPIDGFRVPPATIWVDAKTFETLRLDSDDPTLGGKVTVLRTTREYALKVPAKLPELNETQSIPLPQAIPNVHDLGSVTYTFTLKDGADGAKAFALDDRQAFDGPVPAVRGGGFAYTVKAVRSPEAAGPAAAANPGAEYLSDSFFIDWDNDLVKAHARAATAALPASATAWDRAKAVEAWVHRNMKAAEYSQAMATCKATAKALTGDCTEYAMLAAGMCRAAGVPSRTALGLVYAPGRDGKPTMAYHMWLEVFADGHWLALDATLGRGSVGPGHLKITHASWHEEKSLTPLLPVLGLLGSSPKITAVSATK